MFATLWFLIKISLIMAIFGLVMTMGGSVTIAVGAYTISMALGVFILAAIIGLWVISVIGRAVHFVVSAPTAIAESRERHAQRKGLQALAYGLSAIAAGDVNAAHHYTKRVIKYFRKDDFGLSDLMEGLTARLKGDETAVRRSFHAMMLHKETSFLGLKGLLQTAIEKKDYRYARILAEKAYAQHPDQPWIIKTLYDLQLKTHQYEEASSLLKTAERAGVLGKDEARSHKAALLLGQGQIAKAYKANPMSLSMGLAMLEEWAKENKRRKSLNLIKKLWQENPHPELMDYWVKYAPKKIWENNPAMAAWVEDLYRENPQNASSALYTGDVLIHMGQKEQARRFIKQAISLKPTLHAYQAMSQIDGSENWTVLTATAKADKIWVCTKTGHVYDDWQLVTKDGCFNSLVWDYPESVVVEADTHEASFLLAA